jgi:hypothetical protein
MRLRLLPNLLLFLPPSLLLQRLLLLPSLLLQQLPKHKALLYWVFHFKNNTLSGSVCLRRRWLETFVFFDRSPFSFSFSFSFSFPFFSSSIL